MRKVTVKDYTALTLEHEAEFYTTFGVKLRGFMHGCMGFDLLRFDDTVIKPNDGVSTRDTIKQRFGERAVELVSILW